MHIQKPHHHPKNSIACVALPPLPLALAEAQRYLLELLDKVEPLLVKHQLQNEDIILRMTGFASNGCGRSPAAEIGLIGTCSENIICIWAAITVRQRLNKV